MDLKQILELLGNEHVAGDEMTGAFLEDAVACFGVNPAAATRSIRELQANDPSGFTLAAVRLLTSTDEKSPGVQYVAGLMFAGDLLINVLMDHRILTLEAATSLAKNLIVAEPLLDVRLVNKMMADAGGDIRAVKPDDALRVLALVEGVSDCSRLSSSLVQLLRHPSAHLRSKVARLLGRANLNLNRIKSLLASDDARLRANALECLWESKDPKAIPILLEASKDKSGRVAINALVGLWKAGESDAGERLKRLAGASDASTRAGVAWAIGQLAAPEFAGVLESLAEDRDEKVRMRVAEALKKLPAAAPSKVSPEPAARVDQPEPAPVTS